MSTGPVRVRHIYEREARKFEDDLNEALRRIVEEGGTLFDVKYVSDPPSRESHTGGFGALVIYEVERHAG